MYLLFRIYYLLFGSIFFFGRLAKDNYNDRKHKRIIDESNRKEELFNRTVCVSMRDNSWKDPVDYNRNARREYDEMIRYLIDEGLERRYVSCLSLEWNVKKIMPRVYMANRGMLGDDVLLFRDVITRNLNLAPEISAALFKWFDKTINSFYPQYYVVAYNTVDDQHETFQNFRWNALIYERNIVYKRISRMTMDEINHLRW